MVDVVGTAASQHYRITARPNCSLSPAATLCVFSSIALITLLLSLVCVILGAWPVLPFAGAELLALWFCLRQIRRHADDYECLTLDDDKIVLDTHMPGQDRHAELSSYWARVVMDCLPDGSCARLALRSHGREFEFGRLLSCDERLALGQQLSTRLGGGLS